MLAVAMPIALASGQEIRLQPTAQVGGGQVRLSDVAGIYGCSEGLANVVVLSADDTRPCRQLTIDQLQLALRQAGVNPAPISFAGAARCLVRLENQASRAAVAPGGETAAVESAVTASLAARVGGANAFPAEAASTLRERIVDQLVQELGADRSNITVRFSRADAARADLSPLGTVTITGTNRNCLGRRRWRADYMQASRKYSIYMNGLVSLTRQIVVARRTLAVGTQINSEDVDLVARDDAGRGEPMTDLGAVVGRQVRRSIGLGEVVEATCLTDPLLIQRGQAAWVTCGVIRLQAKALGQGRLGDRVEFANQSSNRRFWAVMMGPGRAEVSLNSACTDAGG